jgi:hypothetical protein
MNSAINNTINLYLENFMTTLAARFNIDREEIGDIWKEVQNKKIAKNKRVKRKSSAPSAYILFSNDERIKIKETNPTMSFVEISKEVGKRWKMATPEKKDFYNKKRAQLLEDKTDSSSDSNTEENHSTTGGVPEDADTESDTEMTATASVQEAEEKLQKPKKSKKPKKTDIPEEIVDERERELWVEFAGLTITQLRTQCDHNNIKTSKNRNDMIHNLILHRIALEDGNTQIPSDDEEEDF